MKSVGGAYTGNATDNRDITVEASFGTPDFVYVARLNGLGTDYGPWVRTSTMTGDSSKKLITAAVNTTNAIQAFGDSTFTVGTAEGVNRNANAIDWFACRDNGTGGFAVFTYTGNGAGQRTVGSFTFTPVLAIVLPEAAVLPVYKNTAHGGTNSQTFTNAAPIATGISALNAGSITVETGYNTNLAVYHVAVWAAGAAAVLNWTGNGLTDQTHAHGLASTPIVAVVQGVDSTSKTPAFRVTATATGPALMGAATAIGFIDLIDATNVRVDSDTQVNEDTKLFTAFAIADDFVSGGGTPGNSGNAPGRGRGNPAPGGGGKGGGGGPTSDPLRRAFVARRRRTR